ncbi:MAG: arginine-tRNA-protein transferase [Saprospiraceae bacterium]|nr:arginine-tRNA-protein transferase [Saprospiraceae bacterium]
MFAEKHYPEILMPEELDSYLEKGWYRMGQTIFTTHFLCFGDQFYSAVWVRLPIQGYAFRKSARKLIRKSLRQFRVEIRQGRIDVEKERLYRKYKGNFQGIIAPTLRDSLLDGEDYNIYNTQEVSIYDGNRLIGCSFFDLGADSAASIIGIYDPDYHAHSLGYLTMLLEITFCMERGLAFYYPGYVVPGYQRFDYKLRIGDVEYFDLKNNGWLPYKDLKEEEIPLERIRGQLHLLQKQLKKDGFKPKTYYYPLFEANLFGFWRAQYFDHPMMLLINADTHQNSFLIAVYNLEADSFQLLQCSIFDDLQFYFNENYINSFDKNRFFMKLLVIDKKYELVASAKSMSQFLKSKFSQSSSWGF